MTTATVLPELAPAPGPGDDVQALLEDAVARRRVAVEAVLDAAEAHGLDDEALQGLWHRLAELGVEVTEGPHPAGPARTAPASGPEDAMRTYLRQISQVPLLTAAEERSLAIRIERGDPVAFRRLVEANLRLVVSVARRSFGGDLAPLDLIQEGNIGLMRAAERFDHRLGNKFSTYAVWWIRQAIHRAIANQGRTIRVPVHMVDEIGRLSITRRGLRGRLGREPSDAEIAAELGVTAARVREVRAYARRPVSLDEPLGDGSDLSVIVEDRREASPLSTAIAHERGAQIRLALARLDTRARRVLEMRYGLDGTEPCTLEEIGRRFDVTRERIRQIETRALASLYRDGDEGLHDFIE